MRTDPVQPRHPLASRRILRLALGTAIALWFSQAFEWPLSYISAILTMVILGLPLPVFNLRKGLVFVLAMLIPMMAAMWLLPIVHSARWAGILLIALAMFHSFYYTAKGGSAILGMFLTTGLTLTVTVGSVSPEIMLLLVRSLAFSTVFSLTSVWLVFALIPDPPQPAPTTPPSQPGSPGVELTEARRKAFRALLVVFPLALVFLFMSASPQYTVVMIKAASMGQQASTDKSREMGSTLLLSTVWGGFGAIVAWYLMRIWPSLTLYTVLIALACLLYGRRIFRGVSLHPQFSLWSYALVTMLVVLAPALLDGPGSQGAGAAFWQRLSLIVLVAVYGSAAVAVFDAFWPQKEVTAPQSPHPARPL